MCSMFYIMVRKRNSKSIKISTSHEQLSSEFYLYPGASLMSNASNLLSQFPIIKNLNLALRLDDETDISSLP